MTKDTIKTLALLPLHLAISVICPRLMQIDGIIGNVAAIIFAIYLVAMLIYLVRLNKRVKQDLKKAKNGLRPHE